MKPQPGRRALEVGACLLLAAAALAASGDFPASPYTDALVAMLFASALIALGWFAGWSMIWIFSICLVVESAIYTELFWTDDPTRSGMDDLSPGVAYLLLPFAWVAIFAGVAGRKVAERLKAPSSGDLSPGDVPRQGP